MKRSHLVIFSSAFGLLIASFVISAMMWGSLPDIIPTHFGFSGAPDDWSVKNAFSVFFVPAMQLFLFILFAVIYKHPQYSSWPTTLILMTVEEKKREKVFEVMRSMNTTILFVISLFFSYLQYVIMATANQRAQGLTPAYAIIFIAALFLVIIYYSIKMFSTIRKLSKP